MDKILKWGVPILLLVLVIKTFTGGGTILGATWAGGASHTNSKFDAVGGFSVNGTDVITSSTAAVFTSITNSGAISNTGSLTLGGGTAVTKISCASAIRNVGSMALNATTTFDFALTGVATSSNQTYSVGIATSSAQYISATAQPTSTAGFVTILLKNNGATWNVASSSYSVCLTQF